MVQKDDIKDLLFIADYVSYVKGFLIEPTVGVSLVILEHEVYSDLFQEVKDDESFLERKVFELILNFDQLKYCLERVFELFPLD
jgi:hypothetical protein